MADATITELVAGTALTGAEEVPIWQDGATYKITFTQLKAYFDQFYTDVSITYDIGDITGLQAALDGKAAVDHTHTGVYALEGHNHDLDYAAIGHLHDDRYALIGHLHTGVYAPATHGHIIAEITGLSTALADKATNADLAAVYTALNVYALKATQVNSVSGETTGGGTLAADRSIGLADTAVTPGAYARPANLTVDAKGRITAIENGGIPGEPDVQKFTASGTWTKPDEDLYPPNSLVRIRLWGAGGGGGRSATAPNSSGAGHCGGAGGAFIEKWMLLSQLGATEAVTIGAGGAGRTGSTGNGSTGGNTTFGSHATAYGGLGGTGTSYNHVFGPNHAGNGNVVQINVVNSAPMLMLRTGLFAMAANTEWCGGSAGGNEAGHSMWGGGAGAGRGVGGGQSLFGGNGGAAYTTTPSTASAPGGGGAASSLTNTNGADGARGEAEIVVFPRA